MKIGVLLLNFGEPEHPTLEEVVPFLERIFSLNAPLMGPATPEAMRARSRSLAEARAPGLIEEYRAIGGSPLHRQAAGQAEALHDELRRRGHDAMVLLGMQFTEPSISAAVATAQAAGVERLVGIPIYPLAGPSTTLAALDEMSRQVERLRWRVPMYRVSGWHLHPGYLRLRADAIQAVLGAGDFDHRGRTRLVFSAHGTPIQYLEEGSRYTLYVEDFCARIAAEVGAEEYVIGYQNHTNRPGVRWTQPDVGRVIAEIDADRVVVDAVSFMHEQSETLAELDRELRGEAEGRGLEFHRVPVPHDAPGFAEVLADLVQPFAAEGDPGGVAEVEAGGVVLRECRCSKAPGTYCMNPVLHG
ncbi:MAG: ferrochelatase [Gemmatimonadota bacterium]|nr:ferrochelatase [Gemmatimonadota bacterium]